jgi:hypothetical protein
MHHRRLLVVMLTLLSIIAFYGFAQAQPIPLPLNPDTDSLQNRALIELLINTDFELDSNGDKLPDGWTGKKTDIASTDKLKCNKPEKVFAYSGDCAFMFKGNPGGDSSKLVQQIADISAIIDGSELFLSAHVDMRSGVPGSKIASVKIKLSDDSKLKLDLRLPASPVSGYTQLLDSLPISIPAGVSITEAALDFRYGETSGKYLADDVNLAISSSPVLTNTPAQTSTLVPTAGATSTATMTPTPFPPAQLLADDGGALDNFGASVSISADGSTALVGAHHDDVDGNQDQGSAYVYVRSNGGVWTQQAQLSASDGAAFDSFAWSVSLSADGNTALIGAFEDDLGANSDQGSAYVFVRNGTTWTPQQQLTANNGSTGDYFGHSVSLSADGNTALIGAYSDDVGMSTNQGSAYVFVRSGSTWTQQQQITSSDGVAGDFVGYSVGLSADGSTAVLGAPLDTVVGNNSQGSAYVFIRTGTTWTQQQQLLAGDGAAGDWFGVTVTLNADGSTALVGAYNHVVGTNTNQGAAYVFTRTGATWSFQQQLTASDGATDDRFGGAVSLSGDGNLAFVSARFDTILANASQGSAYLFRRTGTSWTQQQQYLAPDGAVEDYFGISVDLSTDGSTVISGAFQDDIDSLAYQGSAWVFDLR